MVIVTFYGSQVLPFRVFTLQFLQSESGNIFAFPICKEYKEKGTNTKYGRSWLPYFSYYKYCDYQAYWERITRTDW